MIKIFISLINALFIICAAKTWGGEPSEQINPSNKELPNDISKVEVLEALEKIPGLRVVRVSESNVEEGDGSNDHLTSMIDSFVEVANQGAPRLVDEFTRLERVYSRNLEIVFDYTVLDSKLELSESEHKERLKNNFIFVMCSTPKFYDELLKKNVKQIFKYSNAAGKVLIESRFSINDCS